jgi:hypothetical protein
MRQKILAAVASCALALLTLAPTAHAATPTVVIYGDINYLPTATSYALTSSVSDLHNILYGGGTSGDCPSRWWRIDRPNSWYACISSFRIVNADCHWGFAFYDDINYSILSFSHYGNYSASTIPNGDNDNYMSIKLIYRTNCPLTAGS